MPLAPSLGSLIAIRFSSSVQSVGDKRALVHLWLRHLLILLEKDGSTASPVNRSTLRQGSSCDLRWEALAHHAASAAPSATAQRLAGHTDPGLGVLLVVRVSRILCPMFALLANRLGGRSILVHLLLDELLLLLALLLGLAIGMVLLRLFVFRSVSSRCSAGWRPALPVAGHTGLWIGGSAGGPAVVPPR